MLNHTQEIIIHKNREQVLSFICIQIVFAVFPFTFNSINNSNSLKVSYAPILMQKRMRNN
jgi:hypothetical protein